MHAASSDLHVGNAGYRDRSEPGLFLRAAREVRAAGCSDWWWLGDTFERAKFSADAIRREREIVSLFREVASIIGTVTVHVLPGNHDPEAVREFLPWLTLTCGFWFPQGHERRVRAGLFSLTHGDQWDSAVDSWFAPAARACTWLVGNTIERVWPSFPESWASPEAWVRPAQNATRAGAVGCEMRDYARDNGIVLIAGHTHRHDIEGGVNDKGQSWQYVNTGAMSDGAPFSLCLFDPQGGHAQLVRD